MKTFSELVDSLNEDIISEAVPAMSSGKSVASSMTNATVSNQTAYAAKPMGWNRLITRDGRVTAPTTKKDFVRNLISIIGQEEAEKYHNEFKEYVDLLWGKRAQGHSDLMIDVEKSFDKSNRPYTEFEFTTTDVENMRDGQGGYRDDGQGGYDDGRQPTMDIQGGGYDGPLIEPPDWTGIFPTTDVCANPPCGPQDRPIPPHKPFTIGHEGEVEDIPPHTGACEFPPCYVDTGGDINVQTQDPNLGIGDSGEDDPDPIDTSSVGGGDTVIPPTIDVQTQSGDSSITPSGTIDPTDDNLYIGGGDTDPVDPDDDFELKGKKKKWSNYNAFLNAMGWDKKYAVQEKYTLNDFRSNSLSEAETLHWNTLDDAEKKDFAKHAKMNANIVLKKSWKQLKSSEKKKLAQMIKKTTGGEFALEEELTPSQAKKKEEIVLSLKKKKKEFQERYGNDWESVMHATATKMAKKNESINEDDNTIGMEQLTALLGRWGSSVVPGTPPDYDGDGVVNMADILWLLDHWGEDIIIGFNGDDQETPQLGLAPSIKNNGNKGILSRGLFGESMLRERPTPPTPTKYPQSPYPPRPPDPILPGDVVPVSPDGEPWDIEEAIVRGDRSGGMPTGADRGSDEKPLMKWLTELERELKKMRSSYDNVDADVAIWLYGKGRSAKQTAKVLATRKESVELGEAKISRNPQLKIGLHKGISVGKGKKVILSKGIKGKGWTLNAGDEVIAYPYDGDRVAILNPNNAWEFVAKRHIKGGFRESANEAVDEAKDKQGHVTFEFKSLADSSKFEKELRILKRKFSKMFNTKLSGKEVTILFDKRFSTKDEEFSTKDVDMVRVLQQKHKGNLLDWSGKNPFGVDTRLLKKSASDLRKESVDATRFVRAHGKTPRGSGTWFFTIHRGGIEFDKHKEGKDYVKIKDTYYTAAAKKAEKMLKSKKLFVAESVIVNEELDLRAFIEKIKKAFKMRDFDKSERARAKRIKKANRQYSKLLGLHASFDPLAEATVSEARTKDAILVVLDSIEKLSKKHKSTVDNIVKDTKLKKDFVQDAVEFWLDDKKIKKMGSGRNTHYMPESNRYSLSDFFESVEEETPATNTAGVAHTGDDPRVGIKKKKKKKKKGELSPRGMTMMMDNAQEIGESLERSLRSLATSDETPRFRNEYCGHPVFKVSEGEFGKCKTRRAKGERWNKFFEDDSPNYGVIRKYSRRNPNKPIVIQNELNGEMSIYRRRMNDQRLKHNRRMK